jgi:hypothetical protein
MLHKTTRLATFVITQVCLLFIGTVLYRQMGFTWALYSVVGVEAFLYLLQLLENFRLKAPTGFEVVLADMKSHLLSHVTTEVQRVHESMQSVQASIDEHETALTSIDGRFALVEAKLPKPRVSERGQIRGTTQPKLAAVRDTSGDIAPQAEIAAPGQAGV